MMKHWLALLLGVGCARSTARPLPLSEAVVAPPAGSASAPPAEAPPPVLALGEVEISLSMTTPSQSNPNSSLTLVVSRDGSMKQTFEMGAKSRLSEGRFTATGEFRAHTDEIVVTMDSDGMMQRPLRTTEWSSTAKLGPDGRMWDALGSIGADGIVRNVDGSVRFSLDDAGQVRGFPSFIKAATVTAKPEQKKLALFALVVAFVPF